MHTRRTKVLGVKRDIPPIERPMIEDVARRAASQGSGRFPTHIGESAPQSFFEAAPIVLKGQSHRQRVGDEAAA